LLFANFVTYHSKLFQLCQQKVVEIFNFFCYTIPKGGVRMNRRIKEVRKNAELSQADFAEKLQVSRNYITLIEREKDPKIPSDRLITSICREFSINEKWLRTGEGEMIESIDNEYTDAIAKIGNGDKKLQKVIIMLSEMSPSDRELLWNFVERLAQSVAE
jgi:transcriptional regulator with XRE-family HTH domain